MNSRNRSVDAMLLAFVRVLTIVIGVLSTSILSHHLSLTDYGTYASGNLIVTTVSICTMMGLADAANYFYHKGEQREDYVNTVVVLQSAIGLVSAGLLLLFQKAVVGYFDNEQLGLIYGLLVLRPLLTNLSGVLLTLQMVVGQARAVAVRNIWFALFKLAAVFLTVFVFQDLRAIFGAFLLLDVLTILFYRVNFEKHAFRLSLRKVLWRAAPVILKFSVPMGVYLLTSEIMREVDKYVVAAFASTEQLAVYTNCSAQLPIDFIATAFYTIIMPLVTRCIHEGRFENGAAVFRSYLKIGYLTAGTLGCVSILFSRELIQLLYGGDYLAGQTIFILYIIVDALRFAGVTILLAAAGKTPLLMGISCGTLVLNLVLNPLFYLWMGLDGPAVATALIVVGTTALMLVLGAKELHCRVSAFFQWQDCVIVVLEAAAAGGIVWQLRGLLYQTGLPYFVVMFVAGGCFAGVMAALQMKPLLRAMQQINAEKQPQ